jgi:hypothetical protein
MSYSNNLLNIYCKSCKKLFIRIQDDNKYLDQNVIQNFMDKVLYHRILKMNKSKTLIKTNLNINKN